MSKIRRPRVWKNPAKSVPIGQSVPNTSVSWRLRVRNDKVDVGRLFEDDGETGARGVSLNVSACCWWMECNAGRVRERVRYRMDWWSAVWPSDRLHTVMEPERRLEDDGLMTDIGARRCVQWTRLCSLLWAASVAGLQLADQQQLLTLRPNSRAMSVPVYFVAGPQGGAFWHAKLTWTIWNTCFPFIIIGLNVII